MSGQSAGNDEQALLDALSQRAGRDRGLSNWQAASIIADRVPALVMPALRGRYGAKLDDDLAEDALSHIKEQSWLGRFRGSSVGEAVRFVRVCGLNKYEDGRRSRALEMRRRIDLGPRDDDTAPIEHVADATDRTKQLEAREALRVLKGLRARLLLEAGPRRRRRMAVFLRYRLEPEEDFQELDTEEGRRAAARVYQDRSTGKRYALEAARRLAPDLGEVELELLEKLLGEPLLSERGAPERPDDEELP